MLSNSKTKREIPKTLSPKEARGGGITPALHPHPAPFNIFFKLWVRAQTLSYLIAIACKYFLIKLVLKTPLKDSYMSKQPTFDPYLNWGKFDDKCPNALKNFGGVDPVSPGSKLWLWSENSWRGGYAPSVDI